jgi:hypothetical protein
MAVLVEGISVVVRCEAIVAVYPGGSTAFSAEVPNRSLCADGELARVGFMTPRDAQVYVEHLERRGLKYQNDGAARDLVVVDQRTGVCVPCTWAEFGSTYWSNIRTRPISVCRAIPTRVDRVVVPEGWDYESSLSAHHKFVPIDGIPDTLKLVRREQNVDVLRDTETGQDFYIGRNY